MEAAGQLTEDAAAALARWRTEQDDFIKQTGLKRKFAREEVGGFGRSEATKASVQAKKANNIAIEIEKAYNIKRQEVFQQIRSDALPKMLNIGNQNKHIQGEKRYISGRSYIYGDRSKAQELVNKYSGTGEIRFSDNGKWTQKEFIYLDRNIGVHINPETGEKIPTNAFAIHYGKKGTHIIPAKRRDEK